MSSMEWKMQHELNQVEAQIYDLETVFLTTNRYSDNPAGSNVQETSALEVSSVAPPQGNEPRASGGNQSSSGVAHTDERRIFSQTSMTSPIES